MSKLNCEITVYGISGHVQQILTGYFLLKQQEKITITSKIEKINLNDPKKPWNMRDTKRSHAKVVLDNKIIIYYDMHDSREIDSAELDNVDIYFKRSYSGSYIDTLGNDRSKKVFELGLNYWVYPNNIDFQNIKRSLFLSTSKARLSSFMQAIDLPSSLTNAPKLKDLEDFPSWKDKANKKVLFMARTYDPYEKKDRPLEVVEELRELNETRASCIRALKKEFGKNFYGGFSQTKFTFENYKDCVVPDNDLTIKNKYLEHLKQFPICVSSAGLYGSNGWKLGEYVALSKAIVSEKLVYSVPGGFKNGKNYLEFNTPSECVEQTLSLYKDDDKRYEMMTKNAEYYYQYLKPDTLVYNSILKALSFTF